MELSVSDRLSLLRVLPESGNIVTLKVVAKLRNKLALSEEEIVKFSVVTTNDRITWDNRNESDVVDMEITPVETKIITSSLERLNNESKLKVSDVRLWELFMDSEQ